MHLFYIILYEKDILKCKSETDNIKNSKTEPLN